MNMYKVKQSDLIGEIKGFPIEVVQKMVERQVEQGNDANVSIFQNKKNAGYYGGGFDFDETVEGHDFWYKVIGEEDFNIFFERYPNKNIYYRGVKSRWHEIIEALKSLGANNRNNCAGAYTDYLYYIDKDNSINSCYDSSALADILQRGFTELFLPEIETVDIDGKKFRKDEIVEIIKEKGLKEIKS